MIGLFGVTAVGDRTQVELVVTLEHWNEDKVYNRTGLDEEVYSFHNERIPYLVIPVAPGRNISNLIEAAAMNLWGQKLGFHAAKELNETLISDMQSGATKLRLTNGSTQRFIVKFWSQQNQR